MERSAEGTQDVAAVELGNGKKIERSGKKADPGGAANGMKQESTRRDAGAQDGGEETQEKWSAKGQVNFLDVIKAGNNFGMEHTVGECGNGENKADERTGSANVK
jgi:hypothetical protein